MQPVWLFTGSPAVLLLGSRWGSAGALSWLSVSGGGFLSSSAAQGVVSLPLSHPHCPSSGVGLSRKLRLVEGNRQPWDLFLPYLPPSLAFPAHRGLWLPQVPWLHAHVPPGSSRPGLSALRGSREVRALGPCRRSCGHQQSPALAGHWLYPACGSLSAGNYLFFGCRQKSKDFYCEAEWEELVTKGFLTLFTAFSRDQVGSQRRRVDVEASQAALM